MGAVVDRAEELAGLLRTGRPDLHVVTDIRDTASLPCVLVVPVPRRDYEGGTLAGSFLLEWTFVALANGPGDLSSARELEDMIDAVVEVVDIVRAEPASYQIPATGDAVPAYLITYTEAASEE